MTSDRPAEERPQQEQAPAHEPDRPAHPPADHPCTLVVSYNGERKPLHVELSNLVSVVLQAAIAAFQITQNPHLLSLYADDGAVELRDADSLAAQGVRCGDKLLLRPGAVKAGMVGGTGQ